MFQDLPEVSNATWAAASKLVDSKPAVKFVRAKGLYLVAATEASEAEFEEYLELMKCSKDKCFNPKFPNDPACFKSFDWFYDLNQRIVEVKVNKTSWKLSSCTCMTYFKEYMCHHVAYLVIKLKLTELDRGFLLIGSKPKRGRKKKIGSALEFK